jgi:hypothetical protein
VPLPRQFFLLSRQFLPLSREFDKRRLGVPVFRLGSHPVAFSGSIEALLCVVPHAARPDFLQSPSSVESIDENPRVQRTRGDKLFSASTSVVRDLARALRSLGAQIVR